VTFYVPGTEEKDPAKVIMSLQQAHTKTATNTTDIATNTAAITAINAAGYVVGPASATANGFVVYNGTTGKLVKDHAATIALASEVSGTLPVANGGTGDAGAAWTTYAPTITAATGTFTSVSAAGSYLQIGKLVHFIVAITITTVGTASGRINLPLPVGTAKREFVAHCMEAQLTGIGGWYLVQAAASTGIIASATNASFIAAGNRVVVTGIYEAT